MHNIYNHDKKTFAEEVRYTLPINDIGGKITTKMVKPFYFCKDYTESKNYQKVNEDWAILFMNQETSHDKYFQLTQNLKSIP